ncbi:hypothetical protein H4S06_003649 [Coemansia sp. BCRC 34490]|nr:hypothetical protein H4S06_003649 [Coemansia sp. BCRC 34490]
MTADASRASEEYEKTVEYVRRLCEASDIDDSTEPTIVDTRNVPNESDGNKTNGDGSGTLLLEDRQATAVDSPVKPALANTRSKGRLNGSGVGLSSSTSRSSR